MTRINAVYGELASHFDAASSGINTVLGDLDKLDLPLASPVSVAILDTNGVIVAVNEAWKNMGRRSSLRIPKFGVGANYLDYCTYDPAGVTKLADELRALLARRISVVTRVYPCNSPTERRWFFLLGLPLAGHDRSGIALLHINLTPFLALSIGQGAEVTSDGVGSQIDFAAVAKSVEESSLEALASQVIQMLGIKPEPKRQQAEQRARQALDIAGLSKRQLEILGLLAQGKTNTEIAHELSRSPHTIKLHVSAILKHLQVKSRTQAALLASKLATEDAKQR